jgi:hypothetical protein
MVDTADATAETNQYGAIPIGAIHRFTYDGNGTMVKRSVMRKPSAGALRTKTTTVYIDGIYEREET